MKPTISETRRTRGGQAIVMVTLGLLAMFGMMGLAVDVGWSFFLRKTAQAAADSAALASAYVALSAIQSAGIGVNCTTLGCTTAPVPCAAATRNLVNGCQYAAQNGFTAGAGTTVTIDANLLSNRPPAHSPGLNPLYWVTVRIQQQVPQLFSAVMGHPTGTTGARATAAIIENFTNGSLILLNRQADCTGMTLPQTTCGVNLLAKGNSTINASGGILMASTRHGDNLGLPGDGTQYAGDLGGSAQVTSPFTGIRGGGAANVSQTSPKWQAPWQNGMSDSAFFRDPTLGAASQPPPPPSSSNNRPIAGCTITGGASAAAPLLLSPGKYYSVGNGTSGCSDGDPIRVTGYVEFQGGAPGFGEYTFFGGLVSANSTNITFNPGRYFLAGVKPKAGNAGTLFDVSSGQVTIQDKTPLLNGQSQPNSDAGEVFVFTDATYPGLDKSGVPSTVLSALDFGTSGFQTGNNNQVDINLHGLNQANAKTPGNLRALAPIVVWQDRRNSASKYYNANGTLDTNCIISDTPCVNPLSHPDSPMMSLQASSTVHLYGVVYQPRGAWTSLTGGGSYTGPLRLITGAVVFNGGADLNLTSLSTPLTFRTVAMIE
jgi:hypothetical protein